MAGVALGRAAESGRSEEIRYGAILRGVADDRRRAVQIDVIDLRGHKPGGAQRTLHRQPRTDAVRMRRGHVVGITALADAEQQDRILAALRWGHLEQSEAGGFADRNAAAFGVE